MTSFNTRRSENVLEAARVAGRTRLVRNLAEPPVRFVQPDAGGDAALVFVSAFGGGLLEGDDYRFDIRCGEGAALVFAPQANTRVFPCPNGILSRQTIHGTVCAGSRVVCGGDPVVVYAESRFEQRQVWTLHPGGRLAIVDWMTAGRLERGEAFAFREFRSEIRIEDPDGAPLLVDRLRLAPDEGARAGMGGGSAHLAAYVAGPGWEALHAALDRALRAPGASERPAWMEGARLAGLGVRDGVGFSLRAVGRDRAALEPLAEALFALLGSPDWAGFDFWKRKY